MGTGGGGKEGGRKQENLEFKASQKQSESCLNKPWIEKVPPRQVVARHGRGVEGEEEGRGPLNRSSLSLLAVARMLAANLTTRHLHTFPNI